MILAGGQGTRLRPLTLARAKPVVPLANRPFLAWQLALLRQHGVTDAVLACSYRVEDLRAALSDAAGGVRLRYVVEEEPLGTGGGIRNAADLAHGDVFVLNGDVLTDADLAAMRRAHVERGARLSILLARVADPRQYGLVETAPDGRILRFREKPTGAEPIATDTINAGVYLLDAALLARIPAGRPVSIEREVFPALIEDGVPCYGWCLDAYWLDIGSLGAYRAAHIDLLEGRVRSALGPPGTRRQGSWLAGGVRLAADARLLAPSAAGPGVALGPGAILGPLAVVGEGSTLLEGARVERSVLWERVVVGPGAVLEGCVVCAGARIGAGARLGPGAVVEAGASVPAGARLGPEGPPAPC